jgi:hypothetical protein
VAAPTTIFTEMTRLANEHGAVNLGQGFPDFDGPDFVKQAAIRAIQQGHNQYCRMFGIPALNAAIAEHQQRFRGLTYDPDTEITVYSGATEAIHATIQGLCDVGYGNLRRLAGLGLPWPGLDRVAVTPRHPDHIADLLPLLFALRHTPGVERVRPLTLIGYVGFARDLSLLSEVDEGWVLDPGFPLEIRESTDTPIEIDGCRRDSSTMFIA